MLSFFSELFQKYGLDCYAPISLSDCTIRKPYLLEQACIASGTAVMLAVPYYTPACSDPARNLSAYAVARDYHGFYKDFFANCIPILKKTYPKHHFAGFSDHSPIDEIEAAAKAGLGVIGKNHLLLTEKYSSYVFLGEIVTDAVMDAYTHEIRTCENCGLCMKECPAARGENGCLSALTQKKGDLTDSEISEIRRYGSVWGCDICQEVCPHTKRAKESGSIYSPIPYFNEETIPHLTKSIFCGMSDKDFSMRAYSFRGREPILRNLSLFESEK